MSKKILAVVLSLILAFSIVAVPVGASDVEFVTASAVENVANNFLDKLIAFVLKYFNMYWPGYEGNWETTEEYKTPFTFYEGDKSFDKDVKADAEWSLGYSSASLLDGISPMSGDYFLAGSLEPIAGRVPTEVVDDQKVRVYAISDGSGVVVQAVIDGFGLSRGDVSVIREKLDKFSADNNIVAVNVSVLHQHSCIDTLGMNVPLAQALIFNAGNAASGGLLEGQKVEKNQVFMNNLFEKTTLAIKKAVKNMEEGKLYYGSTDISNYMRDKRDPQAMDTKLHRLRFDPTNENSPETWIVEGGVHLMSFGAGGDKLSGDFPYYIEQTLRREKGVNMVYVQGAELAISTRYVALCEKCGKNADNIPEIKCDAKGVYTIKCNTCGLTTEDMYNEEDFFETDAKYYLDVLDAWNRANNEGALTSAERADGFGYTFAQKLISIADKEVALDPVLNIKMKEVTLDVTNEILTLAAREDLLNAIIVKGKNGYELKTEIGYMELGNEIAVFICPGEFDPAIVFGGPESGDAAWLGGEWNYAPLKDLTDCNTVLAFGLCNDQAGYVLRDNEYHSLLSENEEVNVISTTAGSTFVEAYGDLVKDIA